MYTNRRPFPLLAAALLLGAALGAASPAAAQAPALGRIEGRVTDSVYARPLKGAAVQAVRLSPEPRTFASMLTGEDGRFRFDSLVAGRYWIAFSSDLLDSLGVVVPDREVVVDAGGRTLVDLGIPSGATLRAAACPGVALPAGRGALFGTVVRASSEQPLRGARVVVGWNDWTVAPGTAKVLSTPRVASVLTDSLGRYRLCGLPTDLPLMVQVQHDSSASAVVGAVVRDSAGLLKRDLSLGEEQLAASRMDTGSVRAQRMPAASGTAGVSGVVRGMQGQPVADAEVRVAGAHGVARTDAQGRYLLSGQPAGTQVLEARRIGYSLARVPVELRSGRTITQAMQLTRVVSLDSFRVVARRTLYREFESRRASMPFGRFLTEDDILKMNPYSTGEIFRTMPGVTVVNVDGEEQVISSRGSGLNGSSCPTNVVIDGLQHMSLNLVHPSDIAGVEVYRAAAGAPPQYESFCGLIVIWTKR